MIFEFAIEPELVATWHDRHAARYFSDQFRTGAPRVVSKYPSNWKRRIWDAFNALGVADDNTRPIMTALIESLSENLIGRPDHIWDESVSWLENALHEHGRIPFHAILARSSVAGCEAVLREADIDRHPLWDLPSDRSVNRTANELADAIAPLLRIGKRIILVDYMLGLESPRYRQSVAAYLQKIATNRPNGPPDLVEIVTTAGGEPDFFNATCRSELPRLIPAGMKVRIWKIGRLPEGTGVHNRFVLTDRGGISFGWGLDRGRKQDEDDLTILGKERLDRRWQQYSDLPNHFEIVVGPIDIG